MKGGARPGAGRKTAYVERDAAQRLFQAFFEGASQAELEAKIATGNFSIWDRIVLTAMEGDTRILQTLMQKAFPEKLEHSGEVIIPFNVIRGKAKDN